MPSEPERIAKVMARAGIASRRDSEAMIAEGRVKVNGKVIESPALDVGGSDLVLIDGEPLPARERTRLWMYHKPRGLVTTNHDPEGRPTVFDALPEDLPRVLSIGRLDINTEGLLLLTNDGGLARLLELPETGWLRRYRVRAFGHVTQERLDTLRDGVTIEGVSYGPVNARFEREQGANTWLTVDLREGKNREVKTLLEHLGLEVNRLIRISFGPFQLSDLPEAEVEEVRGRVIRDQLGSELAARAGVDFDSPRRDAAASPASASAEAAARPAPSGDDRPRRRVPRSGPSDAERPPPPREKITSAGARNVWRDPEAEPAHTRRAPPRRGADPRAERDAREALATPERRRDKAIADPKGRRVLVERIAGATPAEAPPRHEGPRRDSPRRESPREAGAARPDRSERPRVAARPGRPERAGRDDRPPRRFEERGERPPARAPREERAGGAGERPARDGRPPRPPFRRDDGAAPAAARPPRPPRDGARFEGRGEGRPPRRDAAPRADRPEGRAPRSAAGPGRDSFGGKRFAGKSFGTKSFAGKGPGRSGPGGKGAGGKGPRPGGSRPGGRPGGGPRRER